MSTARHKSAIRLAGVVLCGLMLYTAHVPADEELQERIDQAAELNVTAPWRESQILLDALKPDLHRATPEQRAQISLLEARNLALSGRYEATIGMLAPVRESDLDPVLRLRAFRLSANAAFNGWDFERGFRFLHQGLELAPQVEEPAPKVKLLSLTAFYHNQAGEGEQALEYANDALSAARDSGDARLECIARRELAQAKLHANRQGESLAAHREALAACKAAGDPVQTGILMTSLADILVEHDRPGDALPLIREGMDILEKSGFRDGVLSARYYLAKAYFAEGRMAEAEEILGPLVEEFEDLEYWKEAAASHDILSRIAESRPNYQEALRHQRQAESTRRKFLDRDRSMRLASLQVAFDTLRKEQQIALLSERNRVLELQEQSQRQRRYLAFGGAAAMTVIGLLLLLLLLRTRSDRHHLLWLSQHDGLTGLRNHGSFFRRANKALAVTQRSGTLFTLVVADIDFFKAINDEHGHVTGDAVLREMGAALREVFEPQGIIGRIGGEEFAIALPGIGRDWARELIHELNDRLRPVHENGSEIKVTLSYGLAEASESTSVEKLRLFADQALYEAKGRGRNQIVDAAEVLDDPTLQLRRRADDPK